MGAFINLQGQRFGRLLVQRRIENSGTNGTGNLQARWQCLCDCGGQTATAGQNLRNGQTQSCGCLHRERAGEFNLKHGQAHRRAKSRAYSSWLNAKQRCFNANNKDFDAYGGRGITMSPAWANNFSEFFAHMGTAPEGLELDRIDNEGNYAPGNVRWATRSQQCFNRRPRKR